MCERVWLRCLLWYRCACECVCGGWEGWLRCAASWLWHGGGVRSAGGVRVWGVMGEIAIWWGDWVGAMCWVGALCVGGRVSAVCG